MQIRQTISQKSFPKIDSAPFRRATEHPGLARCITAGRVQARPESLYNRGVFQDFWYRHTFLSSGLPVVSIYVTQAAIGGISKTSGITVRVQGRVR